MGGGVVRNRFRQARYDKLKAALTVKRAKQPSLLKCDPEVSESTTAPGETDGDQEFSSSDSSANEAEHAPSSQMPPSANLTTQNGGISTAQDSQPTQAPPGAGQPVHQDVALSSTVNNVLQEQDPAHSTVQELSDS